VTVTTADAADSLGNLADGFLKLQRNRNRFTTASVENGTHTSAKVCVLTPKFHLETATTPVKKDRTHKLRSLRRARSFKMMSRDQQVIGPLYADHFQPYEDRGNCHSVHAIDCDTVHSLKPG
jgi:hypothetical protein